MTHSVLIRSVLTSASASLVLFAVGCGGVEATELPLGKDFAECGGGFTMSDEVATVDCPNGELRILVSQPAVSPIHFVPVRFDGSADTLDVSAEAHARVPGGYWGVGCLASGPGEVGRGYALLISRSGEAAILRFDAPSDGGGEDGRVAQQYEPLAGKGSRFVDEPSRRHLLRLRCTATASGVVRLRASVDRGTPFAATDRRGIAPYTAAFPVVITDRPRTDIRFDNLNVDMPHVHG